MKNIFVLPANKPSRLSAFIEEKEVDNADWTIRLS